MVSDRQSLNILLEVLELTPFLQVFNGRRTNSKSFSSWRTTFPWPSPP